MNKGRLILDRQSTGVIINPKKKHPLSSWIKNLVINTKLHLKVRKITYQSLKICSLLGNDISR